MDTFNVFEAAYRLYQQFPNEAEELEVYVLEQDGEPVKEWSLRDVDCILNCVADLLINGPCTLMVARLFSPLLLELLSRCTRDTEDEDNILKHEAICKMLGKLIWLFPDAVRFAYRYFENSPHIFARYQGDGEGPPSKKAKIRTREKESLRTLLIAALQFLAFDLNYYKDIWDWSLLPAFTEHGNSDIKWLAYQCIFRIFNISSHEQTAILEDKLSKTDILNLTLTYHPLSQGVDEELNDSGVRCITDENLSNDVVSVQGVLLDKFSSDAKVGESNTFVVVESVQASLHELALAVSSSSPVLLQGPVGCGKTSLVEHLAIVTGRNPHSDVLKIQLGDQMDSKLLIGSYICTETPGEFVWQPGILTQAMTEGCWILLEDIDCAPMEIISVLAPIIRSRSITLPGNMKPIRAHSSFQLFATQRLLVGHDRSYVEFKSNAEMLDKLWRKITIHNLSDGELNQVIAKKWPVLGPIIGRILKVYHLFSSDVSDEDSDKVDDDDDDDDDKFHLPPSVHRSRLISTRDLFKFCKRIANGFNLQSVETSTSIFHHALDCFCSSIPNIADKITAAEYVGVQFNFPKSKATYFCTTAYKPDVEVYSDRVQVGRATLPVRPDDGSAFAKSIPAPFAFTAQSVHVLEKVTVAVLAKEPVLVVGETGTGKTFMIQYLANASNTKLSVINMNQQSDSIDLLGGYKPVDLKLIITPLRDEFNALFPKTFSTQQNDKFLSHVSKCFFSKRWDDLFILMLHTQKAAVKRFSKKDLQDVSLLKLLKRWKKLGQKLQQLKLQVQQSRTPLAFSFIEGALVKAMKKGDWLLLDEINLAEAETLQCLGGLLESDVDSLYLLEKGEREPVRRHKDFRIFACMNPATDVGKKELPVGLRNRFTEFYMGELEDKADLMILVEAYLRELALEKSVIECIVNFYIHIRTELTDKLNDGTGHRPHYSLRTLCRALSVAATNSCGSLYRSLYEAFALSFLSQLDQASHLIVKDAIIKFILGKKHVSVLKQKIPEPQGGSSVSVEGYWISSGTLQPCFPENYVMTNTVRQNLRNLARIASVGKYPVLLQGETSVGKTSLVQFLAAATGNYCVRVNNHEHTDIQEYIGSYCADSHGKLVYKEGILVEAMRKGYWIILDELNLAPSEVMEALNRVLDDNRELFITETQQTVKAHSKFMVFATQNPPGLYGGRKILSRAFRNRFIELYFDEIPPAELEVILEKRCSLPRSYCKKMVSVMQELQIQRRASGIFAGKQGYITLRDLFRWGERYRLAAHHETVFYDWSQHLADEGYMLLAGKVRCPEEAAVIKKAIQSNIKREVVPEKLFAFENVNPSTTEDVLNLISGGNVSDEFKHIVWTPKLRRLAILVGKALMFQEPVLLVGNTGCGKTTICQIFSEFCKKKLLTVNCHMHSESSDFLGNLRPVRSHEEGNEKLFEWVDGPLVVAMEKGEFFLADEISLADDSVLERLNSVLEPQREIRLTEKSSNEDESKTVITATKDFRIMATMNPGGDYGKKELSPALRNRFTEIWCPTDLENDELMLIIERNIKKDVILTSDHGNSGFGFAIIEFLNWFLQTDIGKRITVSIRDILTWVDFINTTVTCSYQPSRLTPCEAYVHGACLVFIDSLGSGSVAVSDKEEIEELKNLSNKFLINQVQEYVGGKEICALEHSLMSYEDNYTFVEKIQQGISYCGFGPFFISSAPPNLRVFNSLRNRYILKTPTTKCNVIRLLRAMQLWKPILLEGNPGVGKTSLIATIANAAGFDLVRINLSEHTDITDLFGTDLPVEGGKCGEFAWRDGPLLEALKRGSWILLDELNLASQSVLEGLNACLDHRGEIYVPELGKTFSISNHSTRIFGCQNPFKQGGSRKGLPRSFLNRFTQVFIKPFTSIDMNIIASHMYPTIRPTLISEMVHFNEKISAEVRRGCLSHTRGYQWEFNLRDIFRWCDALVGNQVQVNPVEYVTLIYIDRMRTAHDKKRVREICESHFESKENELMRHLKLQVFDSFIQVGHSFLPRKGCGFSMSQALYPLHLQLTTLESFMKCIEMNWLPILVGPPDSGKTSMVQLVANLTGHDLKVLSVSSEMDTIELLGGFEQSDPNRLIDAVQDLEPYLQNAAIVCLKATENITVYSDCLHAILNASYNLHSVHCSRDDHSKIYKRVSRYLNCISNAITKLQGKLKNHINSAFSELRRKVNEMSEKLRAVDLTRVGGHFEWVDSVLVQAVQKGYWILVEDVNLCSPSVLDRLNSLLEPGGFLSLFEQGAVDVGGTEMVRTIKPHPDFRIIFTMNPANGEISPAMRNRGVEIAVTTEITGFKDDNIIPDVWDIFSLMYSKGLCDPHVMFCLLKIYSLLYIKRIETPNSRVFHNAVKYCVQLIQQKKNVAEAVFDSFDMAFAKNILDRNARMKSYDLMREELFKRDFDIHSLEHHVEPPCYQQILSGVGPSILDYQNSYYWASMKQQSSLFIYLLKHFLNTLFNHSDNPFSLHFRGPVFTLPPVSATDEWVKIFTTVVRMMFESSSPKQYKVFSLWFNGILDNVRGKLEEQDEDQEENRRLFKKVLVTTRNLIRTHFDRFWNSPVTASLMQTVGNLATNCMKIDKDDIPVDLRYNSYLHQKLVYNYVSKCDDEEILDVDDLQQDLNSSSNRFLLMLYLSTVHSLEAMSADVLKTRRIKCQSLFELSDAFANVNMSPDSLPHPVITNIAPFISTLYLTLGNKLGHPSTTFLNGYFWKVWEVINVFHQFLRFCNEPILDQSMEECVSLFALHYSRVIKKVTYLFANPVFSSPIGIPVELDEIMQRICRDLMFENVAVQKVKLKTLKTCGFPSAFANENCAKIFLDVLEIHEKLNIYSMLGSQDRTEDLKVVITNGLKWNRILVNAVCKSLAGQDGDHSTFSEVHEIKLQLRDLGLMGSIDDDDIMEVCQQPVSVSNIKDNELALNVELLPFWNYFFFHGESIFLSCTAEMFKSRITCTAAVVSVANYKLSEKFLADLGVNKLSYDPVHIGQLLSLHKDEKKGLFSACLVYFFYALHSGPFSDSQKAYLNWNMKLPGLCQSISPEEVTWEKQSPVLTMACLRLLSKANDFGTMSLPLENFFEKKQQIEVMKSVLWRSRESLCRDSFWNSMTKILSCWFDYVVAAMSVLTTITVPATLTDLLAQMWEGLKLSQVFQYGDTNILADARDCILTMTTLMNRGSCDPLELNWSIGISFAKVGLLTLVLFAPLYSHDPVQKRHLSYNCSSSLLRDSLMEWYFQEWQCRAVGGRGLQDECEDVHPCLPGLFASLLDLKRKTEEKKKKLLYRPCLAQYTELKNEVRKYLSLIGSPSASHELLNSLKEMKDQAAAGQLSDAELRKTIQTLNTHARNLKSFVNNMTSKFQVYRDLLFPFLSGVEMLLLGYTMSERYFSCITMRKKFPDMKSAESVLEKMCSFPCLRENCVIVRPLELASFLCSEDVLQTIVCLKATSEIKENDNSIYKLLKSALLEIINETFILRKASGKDILGTANPIFQRLLKAIEQQNDEMQMKKEAETSLYVHKTNEFGGEPTEEEAKERVVKSTFPLYEEDFEEFMPFSLNISKPIPEDVADVNLPITAADILDLWSCHATLVFKLLQPKCGYASHISPIIKEMDHPDYVTPYLLRYEVLKSLQPSLTYVDSAIDCHLVGGHLLAASALQLQNDIETAGRNTDDKYYDIYHDPNPDEVLQFIAVMEALVSRIDVILKEFPENPVLYQILKIVKRIQTFSVTAPLMKFVTGLQLVLESANSWEQNAHKGVSLQPELGALTQKVIYYRKLEYKCWSQCLNSVEKKYYSDCSKWWFLIYSLIFDKKEEKMGNILSSLQQFIEDCTLGEFAPRMALLQTFLLHLTIVASSDFEKKMRDILFNVYTFYNQFFPCVENKVAGIRKPIEKEVKDFVKISRWNDSSFFSVKKSVEKTHHTLLKCMHKYEMDLQQPARKYFHVSDKYENETKPSFIIKLEDFSPMTSIAVPVNQKGSLPSFPGDQIIDDIPRFTRKSKKLFAKVVAQFSLSYSIKTLEEFADDIVESLQHLRSLHVSQNVDKETQMKKFRHIVHVKRKALSDLFKKLSVIGLSYRKGLIFCESQISTNESNSMLVPCLDVAILHRYDALCLPPSNMASLWNDANYYYYKSVAQFSLLELSLQSSNKKLNDASIIKKFKGFAGHVLQNVVSHRHYLVSDAEIITNFSEHVSCLVKIMSRQAEKDNGDSSEPDDNGMYYPPQMFVIRWRGELCNLLVQTVSAFYQFDVLLKCCPETTEEHTVALQPHSSSALASSVKGSKLWSRLTCDVRNAIQEIKTHVEAALPTLESECLLETWEHLFVISGCFKQLARSVEKFAEIHCFLHDNTPDTEKTNRNFTSFLYNLHIAISENWKHFSKELSQICESPAQLEIHVLSEKEQKLASLSEQLLSKVLKSIENIFVLCTENQSCYRTDDGDVDIPLEQLFTEKLSVYLSKFSKCLNVRSISSIIRKVLLDMHLFENSPVKVPVLERYILSVVPVLQQYSQLLKLYLLTSVTGHRTSCKFLSSMLEMFNDFSQKGFGDPPETQDTSASGATKFHDIEQGGLGEGEGVEDVSKDIVSEDQLEDATQDGAEKQENNQSGLKSEDDAIEMSEDFEGEMYDPEPGGDDDSNDDEIDDTGIDKKMGSVEQSDAEKLNEQIWGDESDEDENLEEDDSGCGVTQNKDTELVAKDGKEKEVDKESKSNVPDMCPDLKNEGEYDGEFVDPLIDAPPLLEPEVMNLPEELQIDSDEEDEGAVKDEEDEDGKAMDIDAIKGLEEEEDDDDEATNDYDDRDGKTDKEEGEEVEKPQQMENEREKGGNASESVADDDDDDDDDDADAENKTDDTSEENDNKAVPTEHASKSTTDRALAGETASGSSHDLVQPIENLEDWEGSSSQANSEQHQEGQGGAEASSQLEAGHRGKRSALPNSSVDDFSKQRRGLRRPDKNRSLGYPSSSFVEQLQVHESVVQEEEEEEEEETLENANEAGEYEHVQGGKDSNHQALDAATEEQASQQLPSLSKVETDDDDDVIALDSSSDEETVGARGNIDKSKFMSDISSRPSTSKGHATGEVNSSDEEMEVDNELIGTHGAQQRLGSTIHTQYDLWSNLSLPHIQSLRVEIEEKLGKFSREKSSNPEALFWLWQNIEAIVSPLVQELCEQLRLVLEPTKMSKMKGDYRTGKRLNMRKIIPYIASQFRKDKIWLRRTKPSKRQYQIMLAVDDSYSMSDNHSNELAFESLALIAKSLSFLEAGELGIISFGEDVKLLHSFGETFTNASGAKILEAFSFAQNKTRIRQLLDYVTKTMLEARGAHSKLVSKETAQLLIIISDGRGVFMEGEEPVRTAIHRARSNNIFIVFVVLDNPRNKDSVMDIQCPLFDEKMEVSFKPYMENFPFPFYIVLRSIDALPQVLGEALRQWFELVTLAER